MRPAFVALAGAALLSTAFAAAQALAFATMLAVPVAVATAGTAQAGDTPPLYRWTEPDGSLTFSPTAPNDGTPYEQVDPMTMRPVTTASDGGATARIVPVTPADVAPIRPTTDAARVAPAPQLGAAVRTPAYGASGDLARPAGVTTSSDDPRIVASNDKSRRCGELEKRVVSLERRLATPLSPGEMDDTVVQIARYQQNVERYCR